MKKTDWCLEIIRVQGGYKLRYNVDGEDAFEESVIQDDDDDVFKSGEELLWFVMEHFSFRGSKHGSQRLGVFRENKDGTLDFQGEAYVPAQNGMDDSLREYLEKGVRGEVK